MAVNIEQEVRSIMELYSEGRFKPGLERAFALHKVAPDLAITNYCVGHGLGATSRQREALPYLRKAVQHEPRNADYLIRCGRTLLDLGHIRDAEAHLLRARDINPSLSIIPWTLAIFYTSINRFDLAVPLFETVLKIGLPHNVAHGGRLDFAHALIEVGRNEEAELILRSMLTDPRARGPALADLATIKALPVDSAEYAMLEELLKVEGIGGSERFVLLSAKARSLSSAKDYAREYETLKQAKLARVGKDTLPTLTRMIDDLIQGFTPGMMSELTAIVSNRNFRPIYVVGLPRSGTTLTERILASHSEVGGAGELYLIKELVFGILADKPAYDFLDRVRVLGRTKVLERLADVEANMRFLCPGKERIVDKMPHNFLHCGAIGALFPSARIVHVIRSPADNFLSGFKASLNSTHSYFNSPEAFIPYYEQYRKIMEHWYKIMPERIFPLHYEELVTDPNKKIAELLAFCELGWEEDCLYPERSEARISTASITQARRPINAGSLGGWKRYASELQVIVDKLGDGRFSAPAVAG
ncbi:tetratricopeptide repeat-containing sulfotransferase family protein [Aestuariivirga sp.]|uniref:tetratricopeptide repeat-containing sulfotransferase family protein n=1 Tax=Aestuariivirga sp. TaxID=2650926 RepID=UPI0039E4A4AD